MKKPVKKLSASETLEILDNQWASIEDIMKLAFIGIFQIKYWKKDIYCQKD